MIEILSMLGSWVSGIGAVSAVIYAVKVNQPKLHAIVSDVRFDDEGNFTIDAYNNKAITAHISHIRLVPRKSIFSKAFHPTKFSRHAVIKDSDKRQCDRLNIEVESGGYEQFEFSGASLLEAYCEFCDITKPQKMMRMVRARIAIYLTNGSVCYINLPKSQYQKIKNSMFIPIERRMTDLSKVGINNRVPNDYTVEHKRDLEKRYLDDYEYALKRQLYLQLPSGITIDDFWNNR